MFDTLVFLAFECYKKRKFRGKGINICSIFNCCTSIRDDSLNAFRYFVHFTGWFVFFYISFLNTVSISVCVFIHQLRLQRMAGKLVCLPWHRMIYLWLAFYNPECIKRGEMVNNIQCLHTFSFCSNSHKRIHFKLLPNCSSDFFCDDVNWNILWKFIKKFIEKMTHPANEAFSMPLRVQCWDVIFHDGAVTTSTLWCKHIEVIITAVWFAVTFMEAIFAELLAALSAEEMLGVPCLVQSSHTFL